ncbi:MAG: M14 family metallopeptidase [Gammaproteobacteria bacterium]|nr:M14 family metallopeptidase [Gammaproteobacteria bacterium]
MQSQLETLLTLELPYRERLTLQRRVFQGAPGPRVAVVSGIHGDELEGLYVTHRLAQWLEQLGREKPDALLGRVELYPAMNPLGLDTLERFVPTHGVDLNRNFPGHDSGLLPQRLADAAVQALVGADLVVDIHASNIYLREIPQVRISEAFAVTLVPLAQAMNLDVIWLHGALTVLEATLAHSLNSRQTPCLVVEMGVGMRVTPAYSEQLVTGILRTWQELGVLAAGLELPPATHSPLVADDSNVRYLNADTSGLFIPKIEHWTAVEREQLLGRIVTPYQGETLSEVRSPARGILFTLREYPLVYEGSLMARIVDVMVDGSAEPENST